MGYYIEARKTLTDQQKMNSFLNAAAQDQIPESATASMIMDGDRRISWPQNEPSRQIPVLVDFWATSLLTLQNLDPGAQK